MPKSKKRASTKAARSAERNKNKQPEDDVTWRKSHFQCFCCFDKDIELTNYEMFIHEELNIAACDSCANGHFDEENDKWHGSKYWQEFDENGKCMYCTICAEGGTLMACDMKNCQKSYCLDCLGKWIGQERLDNFVENEDETFCCFFCFDNKARREEITDDDSGVFERIDDEMFKRFKRFQKATKSYAKQKDKIDDEDRDIRLNKSLKSNEKTKHFFCYSCFSKCEFSKTCMPDYHPRMKVLLCADCHDFLDINGGHDPDEYCFISGEGGELIDCDNEGCTKTWSTEVLRNWLGYKQTEDLLQDEEAKFICPCCEPKISRAEKYLKQSKDIMDAFKKQFIQDDEYKAPETKKRKLNTTSARATATTSRRNLTKTAEVAELKGSIRRSGRNRMKQTPKRGRGGQATAKVESHGSRRSGRGRPRGSHYSESESEDEVVIEKRVTRVKEENSSKYLDDSDIDHSSDFMNSDEEAALLENGSVRQRIGRPSKSEEPPTAEEQKIYFQKVLNRNVSKRFKQTDMFNSLMNAIDA